VGLATADYQAEQDTLAGFLADCCHLHPECSVKASTLYDAYVEWSGDRLTTGKAFGQRLRDKGYDSKRGYGGAVFWQGIGLLATEN
jgi:phage/plasmid-associated DNA primase